MTSTTRLFVTWSAAAVVVVVALSYGALAERGPSTNQERVYEIAQTLRCPQCTGQSVAESDVAIAREIRTEIAVLLEEGLSDDEIRAQIASGYEEDIRYLPSSSGVTGLVWIIPVVAGFAAAAILVVVFRRWGSRPQVSASEEDRQLVSAALIAEPSGSGYLDPPRSSPANNGGDGAGSGWTDDPDRVGEGEGR